jgi:diadenosine tetraphosphate (Ap4A) HIT family hydrolase
MLKTIPNTVKFGSIDIKDSYIFYYRKYVFAFVNLRPVTPGHVLLCPVRKEKKYKDLTETEAMELWISAKKISDQLKKFYNVFLFK